MTLALYFCNSIFIFLCMFETVLGTTTDSPCAARAIANRSVICVCNSSYCDTITRVKPPRSTYVAYTSSEVFKRADGLPDGKQLPSPMDTRKSKEVTSALPAFKGDGKRERKKDGIRRVIGPIRSVFLGEFCLQAGLRFEKSFGPIVKSDATDPLTLLLHPEIKYQTIKGFGGAITDSAAINWLSLQSPQLRQQLIDSYFSHVGIEYNCLRVPIGGTDFSTHKYAYNELPENDTLLRNFSLSYEDYNYKIPMIKAALNVSCTPLLILASSWAPPGWMTEKSNYTTCGRLKTEYYQTYAEYHYKFVKQYEAAGVPVWGITTSNEPSLGFLPLTKFNCLTWTAQHLGLWINHYLGPRIRASEFGNIKILGIDDRRITISLWFTELLQEHPSVINILDGVGIHDYSNKFSPPEQLRLVSDTHPDKFIMGTEYSEGGDPTEDLDVDLGSWERATKYITNIITDLNYEMVGWLDWNICLNEKGGPTWNDNYIDSPIIVSPEKGEFYKQPMFYAMGHVSKFVPRGSRRIHQVDIKCETTVERPHFTISERPEPVTYVAFLTPDNTIVVVINNSGDSTDIQIQVRDNQASINVEANSIVTVEFLYEP